MKGPMALEYNEVWIHFLGTISVDYQELVFFILSTVLTLLLLGDGH